MTLEEVLREQAGVITLAQVVACGLSADTAWRRVRSGSWTRLYPGVFLAGGHRLTGEARVRAAALHSGALLSGPLHTGDGPLVGSASAAFWHGMLRDPGEVAEIVVPPTAGLRSRTGLRVRRRIVAAADRVVVRGVAVVAPPRAALDTAVAMTTGGPAFLDRALQKHVRFPGGVPRLLPIARVAGVGEGRSDAHRRGRRRRVGGRTTPGEDPAPGRDHRVDARSPVRPVHDRPGVSGAQGRGGGRRLGLARRRRPLPDGPAQGQRARRGRAGRCCVSPGTTCRSHRPPS
ncbi:type IV toxin-antitoxin system AbiEi family antitoxin domain-containing protein [Pseudonocardia sp. KRD-291]|nr:type IV toxin-antitoxin system AbiEi family antitoxin domain-containing protein [Pseudonocardia sp. KRD291]